MTDTSVKLFHYENPGVPQYNGTAGTLISVLDAILVSGFGSVVVDALSVSDDMATAIVNTGHGFSMYGNTAVGPVITIEGATPAALNGEWRIASVPNASTFTFATAAIADCTATGTIAAKRAPAGWLKLFSDTNKAVYAKEGISPGVLWVHDQGSYAEVRGYESMSAIDTGVGRFPSGASYFFKSTPTANRRWWAAADHRAFYLIGNNGSNDVNSGGLFFGELAHPILSGSSYACGLIGGASNSNSELSTLISAGTYAAIMRGHDEVTQPTSFFRYGHVKNGSSLGAGGHSSYPAPGDGGFHASAVEAWDSAVFRGWMPGMYSPLHNNQPTDDLLYIDTSGTQPFRAVAIMGPVSAVGAWATEGPWR